MSKFTVLISKNAAKELQSLPKTALIKIKEKLVLLESYAFPVGVKKLIGTTSCYRLRCGDYRILYLVDQSTIKITNIAHRRDVYRF